jgi:hypothetical protein
VFALSIPIEDNGTIPLLTLTLTHNHVNATPKQAHLKTTSRPHHHATPSKITVGKMYSSQYKSVKKRVALAIII